MTETDYTIWDAVRRLAARLDEAIEEMGNVTVNQSRLAMQHTKLETCMGQYAKAEEARLAAYEDLANRADALNRRITRETNMLGRDLSALAEQIGNLDARLDNTECGLGLQMVRCGKLAERVADLYGLHEAQEEGRGVLTRRVAELEQRPRATNANPLYMEVEWNLRPTLRPEKGN